MGVQRIDRGHFCFLGVLLSWCSFVGVQESHLSLLFYESWKVAEDGVAALFFSSGAGEKMRIFFIEISYLSWLEKGELPSMERGKMANPTLRTERQFSLVSSARSLDNRVYVL